uniref:Uncharacterized protein n=1 Tax=Plectus sambesii TaxID=2011161 RepID=A0A914WZI7_9BILA
MNEVRHTPPPIALSTMYDHSLLEDSKLRQIFTTASDYPRPTSSAIIRENPTMLPIDARRPFPFFCASGMMSSITTQIIAPAANASAYGIIDSISVTAAAPITADNGSTCKQYE